MGKVIDADELEKKLLDAIEFGRMRDGDGTAELEAVLDDVRGMPEAVIHCKDCKHRYEDDCPMRFAEPQWIPASIALPGQCDRVLCQTQTKKGLLNYVIGYYDYDHDRWCCGMNSNVIAWMPLPEPYEGTERKTDG